MIPHDRAFDHLQSFRWGLVYLIDIHSLSAHAMDVENAFSTGKQHCTYLKIKFYLLFQPSLNRSCIGAVTDQGLSIILGE